LGQDGDSFAQLKAKTLHRLQILESLLEKVLSASATSASSEGAFSLSGLVLMHPDRTKRGKIVVPTDFLKCNSHLLF